MSKWTSTRGIFREPSTTAPVWRFVRPTGAFSALKGAFPLIELGETLSCEVSHLHDLLTDMRDRRKHRTSIDAKRERKLDTTFC